MNVKTTSLPYVVSSQIGSNKVVHICSAYVMRRSDKQPDRVEISPEQLSAAAIEAEASCCVGNFTLDNGLCR